MKKRASGERPPMRPIRIVFFVNEEEPYFTPGHPLHQWMGSRQYAQLSRARGDRVAAMLSLETLGYYSHDEDTQCLVYWKSSWRRHGRDSGPLARGPDGSPSRCNEAPDSKEACRVRCTFWGKLLRWPLGWLMGAPYTRGDFVAVVANFDSRPLMRAVTDGLRAGVGQLRVEGIAMSELLPGAPAGWSDHASFWEIGAPAVMVTDTAPLRYPYYHWPGDNASRIDYRRLAAVVRALTTVVHDLADGPSR